MRRCPTVSERRGDPRTPGRMAAEPWAESTKPLVRGHPPFGAFHWLGKRGSPKPDGPRRTGARPDVGSSARTLRRTCGAAGAENRVADRVDDAEVGLDLGDLVVRRIRAG